MLAKLERGPAGFPRAKREASVARSRSNVIEIAIDPIAIW
jgi:hypothetical protein